VDFLNGFNTTIAVYGQTGSGKTFTMFGEELEGLEDDATATTTTTATATTTATTTANGNLKGSPNLSHSSLLAAASQRKGRGLVPRACEEIFAEVQYRREQCKLRNPGHPRGYDAELAVSYVEVYGNRWQLHALC